ncbi:hypothetical protein FGRMN_11137 [Fusarium graminum]|nr:hypothetical protein FGRMN_11137 [Fusarium graminum]
MESSIATYPSTGGSATTELGTSTSGLTSPETSSAIGTLTSVESSTNTTDGVSSFTTILSTSTVIVSRETETHRTDEAASTRIEATITTAGPTKITNLAQNGGFEDFTIDMWEVEGAFPEVITNPFFCAEGSTCLQLPADFDNSAKVCQRVVVEAGFGHTFEV